MFLEFGNMNTKNKRTLRFKKPLKTFLKKTKKQGLIRNVIGDNLYMPRLKSNFKTFFTLDYMNYINLDTDKRHTLMSTTQLYHNGSPILIEGYLAVKLACIGEMININKVNKADKVIKPNKPNKVNIIYDSYMLESLKVQNNNDVDLYKCSLEKFGGIFRISNLNHEGLLQKKMEIMKQAQTIIKYIAIILAHQLKIFNAKNFNATGFTKKHYNNNYCEDDKSVFEVIKVQMRVYNDFSLILDKCIVKNNSDDSVKDSVKGKILLYKLDLTDGNNKKKHDIIPKQLAAKDFSRSDFNNKFIIIASEYITKDRQIKGFDYKYLVKKLKGHGLEFADFYSTVDTKPAFIWFDVHEPTNTELIRQHYNTMAYVGNNLDNIDSITDKDNLFFNLKKYYPREYSDFLAESFLLTRNTKWHPGEIYIVRPINAIDIITKRKGAQAAAGKDIVYVVDEKTLHEAKKLLSRYDNVLVSNYIRNPLLFKGLKFHFRILFLITLLDGKLKTYMLDNCKILTAGKPFVLDNFNDKAIHDTHVGTTSSDYIFPEDFTTENMGIEITNNIKDKLIQDMRKILKKVSHVISQGKNRVKLYDNFKNGFEVLGVDMMVLDNLQPILIEINNKAGFSNKKTEKGNRLQETIFDFIDDKVLAPLFGNGNSKEKGKEKSKNDDPDLLYSD